MSPIPRHDRWLDDAKLVHGGCDLRVLRCLLNRLGDQLQRLDVGDRDALTFCLKGHFDRCCFMLPCHVTSAHQPRYESRGCWALYRALRLARGSESFRRPVVSARLRSRRLAACASSQPCGSRCACDPHLPGRRGSEQWKTRAGHAACRWASDHFLTLYLVACDFLDAEFLAGQHGRDVDPLAMQAEPSASGDEEVTVVERVGEFGQTVITAR